MAETLSLEALEKYADNIYEAIVIISKRARQINEFQKKMLENQYETIANDDDFDDEGVSRDLVDHQYIKLPNPTSIALKEMLEGKLEKGYPDTSDSE
jgi:DNA-directed RNA polymerase subunit K/omega